MICDYQRPWYKRSYFGFGMSSWNRKLNVETQILNIQASISNFMLAYNHLTQWFRVFMVLNKKNKTIQEKEYKNTTCVDKSIIDGKSIMDKSIMDERKEEDITYP